MTEDADRAARQLMELWTSGPRTMASLMSMAPQYLAQSINSGWTFGNTMNSITNFNSHAPETEMAIVREISYGRQIGTILDALNAMTPKIWPDPKDRPEEVKRLNQLYQDIEDIKTYNAHLRQKRAHDDAKRLVRDGQRLKNRKSKLQQFRETAMQAIDKKG